MQLKGEMTSNLRVGCIGADVVDPPRDLEVEDCVEGIFTTVDDVRRQLQLLPAADDVRALAAIFRRKKIRFTLQASTISNMFCAITVVAFLLSLIRVKCRVK